jgi:hypothetical protein
MKITSDLTNLTTAILILTVQMFIEWTLYVKSIQKSKNHQRRIFLDNYYRQRCLV